MTLSTHLTQDVIDISAILAELKTVSKHEGAMVTFHGIMRPFTKQGEPLDKLVLEWHPRMTARSLQEIGEEGLARFSVSHVRIVHRCGPIRPGEVIVFVGVTSDHRREAFQAADYLMDRLKTDAVFWKREEGPFGSRWIEPTERDAADRNRWSDT